MDVLWIATAGTVAVGMEWWARFLHGSVWHGPLWAVHESHHVSPRDSARASARCAPRAPAIRVGRAARWRSIRARRGRSARSIRVVGPAPRACRRLGWFERNDVFAALHAAVAIALIVGACVSGDGVAENVAFGVGIGMTAFGGSYFLVHDGYVHERLPLGFLSRWAFFRRLRGAHLAHHKSGNAPYGLFLGPRELRRSQR